MEGITPAYISRTNLLLINEANAEESGTTHLPCVIIDLTELTAQNGGTVGECLPCDDYKPMAEAAAIKMLKYLTRNLSQSTLEFVQAQLVEVG